MSSSHRLQRAGRGEGGGGGHYLDYFSDAARCLADFFFRKKGTDHRIFSDIFGDHLSSSSFVRSFVRALRPRDNDQKRVPSPFQYAIPVRLWHGNVNRPSSSVYYWVTTLISSPDLSVKGLEGVEQAWQVRWMFGFFGASSHQNVKGIQRKLLTYLFGALSGPRHESVGRILWDLRDLCSRQYIPSCFFFGGLPSSSTIWIAGWKDTFNWMGVVSGLVTILYRRWFTHHQFSRDYVRNSYRDLLSTQRPRQLNPTVLIRSCGVTTLIRVNGWRMRRLCVWYHTVS